MTPALMTSKWIFHIKLKIQILLPKKDIETVMSPIDSITSQDDNFPMDLQMVSEPDLVKTSNI